MIEPERVPFLIVGLVTVLIGVTLFLMDFQRRANRAFGGIAVLRGLTFIGAGTVSITSPQLTGAVLAAQPYLMLPLIPLAFYFFSVFPERRGPLAFKGSGWFVLTVVILLEVVYAANHATVFSLAPGDGGSGFENAGPGWIFTGFGPLSLLLAAAYPALAFLGFVYAWEYVKNPSNRQLHGVVAAGFILNGIFDGGLAAAALMEDGSLAALSGYALAFPLLRAAALLPAAAGLGMIVSTQIESRTSIWWALPGLSILALLSGAVPIILDISNYGLTWHSRIILSLWRLVMPVTVGYALIRSGMLEHVRLPHLWPRGHHKAAARPAASARSTED